MALNSAIQVGITDVDSVSLCLCPQCGQPAMFLVMGTWLLSQTEWVQISTPRTLWAIGQVP